LRQFKLNLDKEKEREPATLTWPLDAMVKLIDLMLSLTPEERPTATQVLSHPYFSVVLNLGKGKVSKKDNVSLLKSCKEYVPFFLQRPNQVPTIPEFNL
jgi:serine/threonine protein kinase